MSASMPPDLLKVKGKPVVMGHAMNLTEIVRIPELGLLQNSTSAVNVSANMNSETHPIRLSNGGKLEWIGTRLRDGQSRNATYVLFDRGSYFECIAVTDSYEFIPSTEDKVGEEEVDVITKRQKIMKAKELAAAQRVASSLRSDSDEESGNTTERENANNKRRRRDSDDLLTAMPINDMKVRAHLARKKRDKDLDGQAQARSSTALGEVRKAEVDWDYDEGIASDDEEGAALSNEEVEDKREEDVDDSDDEDKILTNYGESLSKMLQNQKRAEADQELQKYSDDEDDEDEEGGMSNVNPANPTRPPKSQQPNTPAAPQLQTEERVREDLLNLLRTKENVTIKMILVELGVSARNQKFQLIKSLITELCNIVTVTVDGEQVRYIRIKGT